MKVLDAPVMSPGRRPKAGLVADLIPSLKQLRADGIACRKNMEAAERTVTATSRLILGYWFDQAARLALARSVHKLKGAAFREFAKDIGIAGSRAFDVERLDGHREDVLARCEKEAARHGEGYRWLSWQAALAGIMPSKTYLAHGTSRNRHDANEMPQDDSTRETANIIKTVTWLHGSDEWSSPATIFEFFDRYYHFDIDAAASKRNAKCKVFWTKKDDGLRQAWKPSRAYWMNPPYSEASKWAKKAQEAARNGAVVVGLLANRSATKWYADHVVPSAAVIQLTGRVPFRNADDEALQSDAPFHSIIVIWPREAARRIMKHCTPFTAALLKI
jgi:phage N-6-adenine-methyltransferase